jgi:hypothetical protein
MWFSQIIMEAAGVLGGRNASAHDVHTAILKCSKVAAGG